MAEPSIGAGLAFAAGVLEAIPARHRKMGVGTVPGSRAHQCRSGHTVLPGEVRPLFFPLLLGPAACYMTLALSMQPDVCFIGIPWFETVEVRHVQLQRVTAPKLFEEERQERTLRLLFLQARNRPVPTFQDPRQVGLVPEPY